MMSFIVRMWAKVLKWFFRYSLQDEADLIFSDPADVEYNIYDVTFSNYSSSVFFTYETRVRVRNSVQCVGLVELFDARRNTSHGSFDKSRSLIYNSEELFDVLKAHLGTTEAVEINIHVTPSEDVVVGVIAKDFEEVFEYSDERIPDKFWNIIYRIL